MAAKGHWLALVLGNTQAVGGVHVLQGSAGIHEDEIMHGGLDEIMAQEEAAEQDVLTQLRQRAASLERDLLQRSLDRAAPTSKVHCKDADLCSLLRWLHVFAPHIRLLHLLFDPVFILYYSPSCMQFEMLHLHASYIECVPACAQLLLIGFNIWSMSDGAQPYKAYDIAMEV